MTREEGRAAIEHVLDSVVAEPFRGPDLTCQLPPAFSYAKLSNKQLVQTPDLCDTASLLSEFYSQLFLPYWPMKTKLGLVVKPISSLDEFNASFNRRPVLNHASVPYFELNFLPGTSINAQKVVWSHELGHAALQEIIEDHFYSIERAAYIDFWANAAEDESLSNKKDRLRTLLRDISKEWATATTEQTAMLRRRQAAANIQLYILQNTEPKDPIDSPALLSLHEFFADLIAVFQYQNPNVVGDAFDQLGLKGVPSDYRRFFPTGAGVAVKGWTNLEPHILLTPARHYFGKNLFAKIKNSKKFLTSFAAWIVRELENPDPTLFVSYDGLLTAVQNANTPEVIGQVFVEAENSVQVISKIRSEEIRSYCELDFAKCKADILDQLKAGREGIFQTNVDPEMSNARLIEALKNLVNNQNCLNLDPPVKLH